jgi:uncharacterized glyoxalase superfamily protein PhnB
MENLVVQIFTENLLETFEHYKKAFNATNIGEGYGSNNELIHLEMDIMGNKIVLAPRSSGEFIKVDLNRSTVVLCIKFKNEQELMTAYNILKDSGYAEELKSYPWSPLQSYVTDKYGIMWCVGL